MNGCIKKLKPKIFHFDFGKKSLLKDGKSSSENESVFFPSCHQIGDGHHAKQVVSHGNRGR